MKLIDLQQNTPEWHEFRRKHIGASDAASIMERNPWKTKGKVWEEKMFAWEEAINDNMRRGQALESCGRQMFQIETGVIVKPLVGVHDRYEWMSASFDGLSEDLKIGVEIKCGQSAQTKALNGIIPDYYYIQMQHQMAVAELDEFFYYVYYNEFGILMTVKRNEKLIEEIIKKELEFWETVK